MLHFVCATCLCTHSWHESDPVPNAFYISFFTSMHSPMHQIDRVLQSNNNNEYYTYLLCVMCVCVWMRFHLLFDYCLFQFWIFAFRMPLIDCCRHACINAFLPFTLALESLLETTKTKRMLVCTCIRAKCIWRINIGPLNTKNSRIFIHYFVSPEKCMLRLTMCASSSFGSKLLKK